MATAVNKFYSSVQGCDVTVIRDDFDAAGSVTTNWALTTSTLYTITVNKQMTSFSTSMIQAAAQAVTEEGSERNKTAASISITTPPKGQMSTPPFNGTFVITCTDNYGISYTSQEIDFKASAHQIKYSLQTIPFLVDNVEVFEDDRFVYRENGISFVLHFTGIDYEVPLCDIGPSTVSEDWPYPLTGNDDMRSNPKVIRTFGETLFFETVPMEMLNTDE